MKRMLMIVVACAALGAVWAAPNPVDVALAKTLTDIRQDTARLTQLRAEIDAERAPLAAKLEALRTQVHAQRNTVETLRRDQAMHLNRTQEMQRAVREHKADYQFIRTLILDYAHGIESRLSISEAAHWRPTLTTRIAQLESADIDTFPEAAQALLRQVGRLAQLRCAGHHAAGEAVDQAGLVHAGQLISLGPLSYFVGQDPALAGPLFAQQGILDPMIDTTWSIEERATLRQLLQTGTGAVPVDATLGNARLVKTAQPSLWQHLQQGGIVMIPLALVALIAIVLASYKAVTLWRIPTIDPDALEAFVAEVTAPDADVEAVLLAHKMSEPLAGIVRAAVTNQSATRAYLEELLQERLLTLLPRLERSLGALAVMGGIAPLLGLLGTVTGMIHTFQLVTIFGSGDAKLLSGGISESLITTEVGLVIAIPVLLIHAGLLRRVRAIVDRYERTLHALVNQLKGAA